MVNRKYPCHDCHRAERRVATVTAFVAYGLWRLTRSPLATREALQSAAAQAADMKRLGWHFPIFTLHSRRNRVRVAN